MPCISFSVGLAGRNQERLCSRSALQAGRYWGWMGPYEPRLGLFGTAASRSTDPALFLHKPILRSAWSSPAYLDEAVLGKRSRPEWSDGQGGDVPWDQRQDKDSSSYSMDKLRAHAFRNKRARTDATAAMVERQYYVGGSPSPSYTTAPTLPTSFIPVSQSPSFLRTAAWWWPMPTPSPSSRNQSLHVCAPSMPPKRKCKECKPTRREYSLFITSDTEAEGQTLDAKAAWDLSQANYKFFGRREWEAKAIVNRYLRLQFHGKPIVDALAALEEEVSSSPLEPKIIEKKQRRRREAPRLSRFGREHMRQQDEIRRTN